MKKINHLYPCGEEENAYLEYQIACPQCGEILHFYFPADTFTRSSRSVSNTCHPFQKTISRGVREFFPHKVIRISEEVMGGRYSLYDNYLVYPLVDTETAEERRARLAAIRAGELSALLKEHPGKKQWIIETVVSRNDTILNALEPILQKYEAEPETQWEALDAVLLAIRKTDDAKCVLGRLGLKVEGTRSGVNMGEAVAFGAQSVMMGGSSFGSFALPMAAKPAPQEAKESWICVCGSVNTSKFCPECGSPSPKLRS